VTLEERAVTLAGGAVTLAEALRPWRKRCDPGGGAMTLTEALRPWRKCRDLGWTCHDPGGGAVTLAEEL